MTVIKKPVLSEKGQKFYQQKNRVCVFYVSPQANKFQIKKSFEAMFQVKVKKVRTSRQKPVCQKNRYLQKFPGKFYTKLQKKAFIELIPGQKISFFPHHQNEEQPKISEKLSDK